jgi:hypothetical protein
MRLEYLPAYSPDFNLIEQAFSAKRLTFDDSTTTLLVLTLLATTLGMKLKSIACFMKLFFLSRCKTLQGSFITVVICSHVCS